MNLFVKTMAEYLVKEWDSVLQDSNGTKEARFIVESLDPCSAFDLFSVLEEHRLEVLQENNIECHFRVAKNLWSAWVQREEGGEESLRKKMLEYHAITASGELKWIDLEDQLTWYRNHSLAEGSDGLIVVLLGFNHATDKGGLADFHLVDESRIWSEIEQNFSIWAEKIKTRFALEDSITELDEFNAFFSQLFKVRPRQLAKLAEFLEEKVFNGSSFYSLTDVINYCYTELPYWGIPPLSFEREKSTSKTKIIEADNFIGHQRFISASDQKKAWKKIEDYFASNGDGLPPELSDYSSISEYTDTLHDFIFKTDSVAKERLLNSNANLILDILKKTTTSKSEKNKLKRLKGGSIDVLLQAIWISYLEAEKTIQGWHHGATSSIKLTIDAFNHDIQSNGEQGIDGHSFAEELLVGCLGGIEELFAGIDLKVPVDIEQSGLSYDDWEKNVPVNVDLSSIRYGISRLQPHIAFNVVINTDEASHQVFFRWSFDANHPERVRFECARHALLGWPTVGEAEVLPAFKLPEIVMTALYFSADEEEANRLLSQSLVELDITDLMAAVSLGGINVGIREKIRTLSGSYRLWLSSIVADGYFTAMSSHYLDLQKAYQSLSKEVLDKNLIGSEVVLKCFYKAFLVINDKVDAQDGYLDSALICGISPSVLELTHAKDCFLRNNFPEVIFQHLRTGNGKYSLDRMFNLVELHRPLAALVTDQRGNLSAEIKSFGLLHYLGKPPSTDKSLAVQTMLREDDVADDESVVDIIRVTEESKVVERVLKDYLQLYPFAQDGVRILAVNVDDLANILSGIDQFLKTYLTNSSTDWPTFHCEVMVYSKSSSPLYIESQLAKWRNYVCAAYREKGRSIILSVAHHFAPTEECITKLLKRESLQYDIAFIFNFLAGDLAGEVEPTLPFKFDFNKGNISQFPVCEYPRPIQKSDSLVRRSLLSNRRLRIQTHHADLTARLRHPESTDKEHLIFGSIAYQVWQETIEALHASAQWVACIDPFIDKRLLDTGDTKSNRKIVGFTSGLGAYGELNLSISTEQDTLVQLSEKVSYELSRLLPFEQGSDFSPMAVRIVGEAEEVIGLSSLRAVVGQGEKIREVIGFSAIHRALPVTESALMVQLLPIDSLLHWFIDSEFTHRPDLLQLSLVLRDGDAPLIKAVLVECKFAQESSSHLDKAFDQIHDGLSHLTELFTPNRSDGRRVNFDRRYWWAQLQRAITTRSVVSMSGLDRKNLDVALEQLVEGYYEIQWQGAIFTFWTNSEEDKLKLTKYSLPRGIVQPPFTVPEDFSIHHVATGAKGVIELFSIDTTEIDRVDFGDISITCAAEIGSDNFGEEIIDRESNGEEKVTFLEKDLSVINDDGVDTFPEPEPEPEPEPKIEPPAVFESKYSAPAEKLLIGTRANGEPVYWHYGHKLLKNRHMLLFGTSGSGKTYGIQCLLAEMAKEHMRSIIIDYTDGFLPQHVEGMFLEIVKPKNHFVVHNKLPINPFRRQQKIIDPSIPTIEESPFQVASRITSIFTSVFGTMGDQQSAALTRALELGIESNDKFTFFDLLELLREDGQNGESLANKIEPFVKSEPFKIGADLAWEEMLTSNDNWLQTLQLSGLPRDIQKLVTEFSLWDLYDFACNSGNKDRPIPIVLDEIQNLDHRSDSPIDKMLREGRKFGLSLMLATQTVSNFNQEQRDRLFQAGHKLFFKPADTEIKKFADILSDTTNESKKVWAERLAKLEKGQCWSLGPVLTSTGRLEDKAVLVSITSFEDRV